MPFLLGVDGGGTGCRAAVADAAGHVLGTGSAGPANILSDPEGARTNILTAVAAALAGSGVQVETLHAVLGLAGANVPTAADWMTAALPFASTRITSDAVTATRGALGVADGVVATMGTGSVFAAQRGGQVTVIGGWGLILGDEGSGAWLGRALMARALLAVDGMAEMTPLLAQVLDEAGGAPALVEAARLARPADFARLAPRITTADDPAAAAVLAEGDAWVCRFIDHLAGAEGLPVTFLGGLGAVYAARLSARYAGRLRAARGSGLDGALALAREAVA